MTRDVLGVVSARVIARDESRARLESEAAAWVTAQLAEEEKAVVDAVLTALSEGKSIAAVARAYTVSGTTPNRNRIYEIKRTNGERITEFVGEYPFEWVGREVETLDGTRTVYDLVATLDDFGPENISGTFRWRYDASSAEVEPIWDPDEDPYPSEPYYKSVLHKWTTENPYPEEV